MSDEENEEEHVDLASKPKTMSAVWNYFGIKSDSLGNPLTSEIEKPVCKLCQKPIPAKGSNTSNLFKHLENNHPEEFVEARRASKGRMKQPTRQPTITEAIDKLKPYPANSSRAQELNRAGASFIASEMQPYQIVEKPGFKKMINKLDPKYHLPTRKYFSHNEIPRMYTEMVKRVKTDISNIKYFAATSPQQICGLALPIIPI